MSEPANTAKTQAKYSREKVKYPKNPTWCPGCGNYGIWGAIRSGLNSVGCPQEKIVIAYDVGCSGNMADFNQYYGFHCLHGRALPIAAGIKLANHNLKVLCVIGDGGCYGEGATHFINLMRGNHDITVLVHNNHRYSLTTGQMSPTTAKGTKTKSTPEGSIEMPLNPIALAIANNATFIAREFAGNIPLLSQRIAEAVNHKGFSLIDILQPCVIFNPEQSYEWYRKNMVSLEAEKHDPQNKEVAFRQALRSDKLATGVFYQEELPAYHEQVSCLKEKTLVQQQIESIDLGEILHQFR